MENKQTYNALVSISHAERIGQALELFPSLINSLHEQGFVSVMQPGEYNEKSQQVLPMRDYKERANASADRANELSEQIGSLETKLNSRLHKWFSSGTKLSREREELSGLRSAYEKNKLEYKLAKDNYERLRQINNELERYVSVGPVYAALTRAGSLTLQRLEFKRSAFQHQKIRDSGVEAASTQGPVRPQEISSRRQAREHEPNLLGHAVDGVAGAVAGDVLDNGQIDGSGGALVGGVLGVAARASGSKPLQRATEGAGLGALLGGPPGAAVGGLIGLGLGALDDDNDRLF